MRQSQNHFKLFIVVFTVTSWVSGMCCGQNYNFLLVNDVFDWWKWDLHDLSGVDETKKIFGERFSVFFQVTKHQTDYYCISIIIELRLCMREWDLRPEWSEWGKVCVLKDCPEIYAVSMPIGIIVLKLIECETSSGEIKFVKWFMKCVFMLLI